MLNFNEFHFRSFYFSIFFLLIWALEPTSTHSFDADQQHSQQTFPSVNPIIRISSFVINFSCRFWWNTFCFNSRYFFYGFLFYFWFFGKKLTHSDPESNRTGMHELPLHKVYWSIHVAPQFEFFVARIASINVHVQEKQNNFPCIRHMFFIFLFHLLDHSNAHMLEEKCCVCAVNVRIEQ